MEPELPRFWDSMSFSVCSSTPSCRESSLVCSTDRVCRALTTSTSDRAVDVAITPVTVNDRTQVSTSYHERWYMGSCYLSTWTTRGIQSGKLLRCRCFDSALFHNVYQASASGFSARVCTVPYPPVTTPVRMPGANRVWVHDVSNTGSLCHLSPSLLAPSTLTVTCR